MTVTTRLLAAALAAATLAACAQAAAPDATGDAVGDAIPAADEPMVDPMVDPIDGSGDTSMPAPEDLELVEDYVTEGEAEAVATAYLGLSEDEAVAQAIVDGRDVRIGGVDGEFYGLTEEYLVGRVTIELRDGTIVTATVESSDGPVTVIP